MTVEHRNDYHTQPELRMKFWHNTRDTQEKFVLTHIT